MTELIAQTLTPDMKLEAIAAFMAVLALLLLCAAEGKNGGEDK